jgi:glycosyltransferase involved in cell wall biosynthesis
MRTHDTESPLVSVVVPSLNRERFLPPTLDSILSQDYPALECLVVDGGSTDGTEAILRSYGDRIRWLSEPDDGPFTAINKGWRLCKGEILAWLNADDTWAPGAAARAVDFLQRNPGVDLVYGTCGGIDEDGRLLWLERPRPWSLDTAILKYDPVINQPACFIRRRAIDAVGGGVFPDWCHDHDLWIRLALNGVRFGSIDEHLANCRVWDGDMHKNPRVMVPAVQRVVDRVVANPLLPERYRRRERRIRSAAYLRCIKFLWVGSPVNWVRAAGLFLTAIRTDPTYAPTLLREGVALMGPLLRVLVGRARGVLRR